MAFFLISVLVSVFLIAFVDRNVALWVSTEVPADVRGFFRFITDWAKGTIWYLLCGLWLLVSTLGRLRSEAAAKVLYWRHQCRRACFFLLSLLSSGIVLLLAKFVIGRFRPRYLLRDDTYGFLPFNMDFAALSYPSGHTQVIFCVATVATVLWPVLRVPAFGAAVILGLSRVMVSAHYPADVVMGAYVGIVVTLFVKDRMERSGKPLAPVGAE